MPFSRLSRWSSRSAPLLLALFLLPGPASAQWPTDPSQNLPVCAVPGFWRAYEPVSCPDGAGGAIIAWTDDRNAGVYAQRVTADGTALWAVDGVLIASSGGYPTIVSDGAGGAIVALIRSGGPTGSDVVAQRISAGGSLQWGASPVVICNANSDQQAVKACTDGAGGAILAWYDPRAGTRKVYVRRVTSGGVPQWAANGVPVSGTVGQAYPVIVADGFGGAIVSWRPGVGGPLGLWAQRVNSAGTLLWGANASLVSSLGSDRPSLAADGTGGAIVCWQAGYPTLRVYAQRMSAGGVPQWPGGGLELFSDPLSTALYVPPLATSDGMGGAIVAWAFNPNTTFDDFTLRAQRISPGGAALWPAGGVTVTEFLSGSNEFVSVEPDGFGGAIYGWADTRTDLRQIYAQRIDAAGARLWGTGGVAVRTQQTFGVFYGPVLAISDGAAIFAWEDPRSGEGDLDIYAQLVRFSGLLGIPPVTINEIRTGQPSNLGEEYIELRGTPAAFLNGLSYVVVGNGPGACGVIESVINLNGIAVPGDGLWAGARLAAPTIPGNYNVGGMIMNFQEGNNVTHLLVSGYNGAPPGTDVDTNDDGILDPLGQPWDFILDRVALTTRANDPSCATAEFVYSPVRAGPEWGGGVPGHVFRCPGTDSWGVGPFNPVGGLDSPGDPNGVCMAILSVSRTPLVPAVGQTVTVTALVGAAVPVQTVELICRVNGGPEGVCSVMADGGGGNWSGTLSSQPAVGTLVEYYVRARSTEPVEASSAYEGYLVGAAPIAAMRNNDPNGVNVNVGRGVMVQGNVTVAAGNFILRRQLLASSTDTDYYVQDATGGINIFQAGIHPVQPALGDLVTVSGTLAQVDGQLRLAGGGSLPDLQVTVNGSGTAPAPQVVAPCGLSEATEGVLVKVQDAHLAAPPGTILDPDTAYPFTDCDPDVVSMYVDGNTDIDGTMLASSNVDVTGICVQSDPSSPYTAGYQVVPRSSADVVPHGAVAVGDPAPMGAPLLTIGANPVHGRTTIAFGIPEKGNVALRIVDVGGRLVQTLVNGRLEAGERQIVWAPARLPAGVYWLRLETPMAVLSRKLIVVR